MFYNQMKIQAKKFFRRKEEKGQIIDYDVEVIKEFISTLPFEPTAAQKRVINEINTIETSQIILIDAKFFLLILATTNINPSGANGTKPADTYKNTPIATIRVLINIKLKRISKLSGLGTPAIMF